MSAQKNAYLYALAAVVCWSTIGSAFKISLRFIDYSNLLLWSGLLALMVHFVSVAASGKLRELTMIPAKTFVLALFAGILNPFLYYLVLLRAYELLPAQEAGTLNYIWPVVLVLLSVPLLRQKISSWSIAAILISFTGILFISTKGNLTGMQFSDPAGVALAIGSAVFWAFYWIINLRTPGDNRIKLMLGFASGFICTLLFQMFTGRFSWPTAEGMAGAVYIGLFEMGITFILWINALRLSVNTARVSNLIYLSPFISLVLIRFVVGEEILWSTVTGLVLIIGGILLQGYLRNPKGS